MEEINILGTIIKFNDKLITIENSYLIKEKNDMILILRLFQIRTNYKSKRGIKSWLKEWKAHNRLYKLGLFKSHCKDCDLEENEKLHRLICYQILGF